MSINNKSINSSDIASIRNERHIKECPGCHLFPTEEELKYCTLSPICFCKKPADRIFTHEYGAILQCANYSRNIDFIEKEKSTNSNNNNYYFNEQQKRKQRVCGFHVHEGPWIKLSQQLNSGHYICSEYIELRTCPMFNFTFCALFGVNNDYRKEPPNWPLCFCNKPVVLDYQDIRYNDLQECISANLSWDFRISIKFICQSLYKDYTRKCNWINEANNAVFDKPKFPVHREISPDVFVKHQKMMLYNLKNQQLYF
ncbi:uncharacterized protein BX663DRAFT_510268 [Cokeromyces recurvatus]|uniref:uncharacterized protein n=1 Tax=Cokeromyces recurvatus TaxID=90255 RepID=UPI00222077CE|nr:uncharacterized protein BX663DRAFT_510268 [Cokeromyces recurvatus]KAI7902728.1 hypothetical protein BX663DRAFT_510268 [Cokeromyces recurvatus]